MARTKKLLLIFRKHNGGSNILNDNKTRYGIRSFSQTPLFNSSHNLIFIHIITLWGIILIIAALFIWKPNYLKCSQSQKQKKNDRTPWVEIAVCQSVSRIEDDGVIGSISLGVKVNSSHTITAWWTQWSYSTKYMISYTVNSYHIYTVTGISLDRFAMWFPKETRSRLIPVTVYDILYRYVIYILCMHIINIHIVCIIYYIAHIIVLYIIIIVYQMLYLELLL